MKIKTSELTRIQLNWAVGIADKRQIRFNIGGGLEVRGRTEDGQELPDHWDLWMSWYPSTDWSQGGPIIDHEISKLFRNVGGTWTAIIKQRIPYYSPTYNADIGQLIQISKAGETPLIAAMRCYVTYKLGDEVEIPDELG